VDVEKSFIHTDWRRLVSRHPALAAVGDAARLRRLDADLAAMLAERHVGQTVTAPYRLWVVGATKSP